MPMPAFAVSISSLKSAERNGGGRAYLARLSSGPGGNVERLFVKATSDRSRKHFRSNACRGDVFEARRWLWDGDRQQYYGGSDWFGVQQDGSVCMLTRDEAFRAVGATAIASAGRPSLPDFSRATRMVPADLCIHALDDAEGPKLIEGELR